MTPPEGRRSALGRVRAVVAAGRSADPDAVAGELRSYAQQRRWLLPVLYVGETIEAVVAGVLLLLRNWRLLLVELVPAVWLGAITWDWRARTFGELPLAEVYGAVALGVAVLVVTATVVAYWCNAVFAFTTVQPPPIDLRAAFRAATAHRRRILAWAVPIGLAHTVVAVFLTRGTLALYSVALGAVVVVQMYGLVALPVALVTGDSRRREHLTRRERISRAVVSGTLTGVASTPGFVLNRLGILMFAVGAPWAGVALLVPAVLFQVAGVASARAVQLAARVREVEGANQHGAPPRGAPGCTSPAPEPPPPG